MLLERAKVRNPNELAWRAEQAEFMVLWWFGTVWLLIVWLLLITDSKQTDDTKEPLWNVPGGIIVFPTQTAEMIQLNGDPFRSGRAQPVLSLSVYRGSISPPITCFQHELMSGSAVSAGKLRPFKYLTLLLFTKHCELPSN